MKEERHPLLQKLDDQLHRRGKLDGEQEYHEYLLSRTDIPQEVKDTYLTPAWRARQAERAADGSGRSV